MATQIIIQKAGNEVYYRSDFGTRMQLFTGQPVQMGEYKIKRGENHLSKGIKISVFYSGIPNHQYWLKEDGLCKLSMGHSLKINEQKQNPLNRLLTLAGIYEYDSEMTHFSMLQDLNTVREEVTVNKDWAVSVFNKDKYGLPNIYLRKAAVLNEKQLQELGKDIAQSKFGPQADYEFLVCHQTDLEACKRWIADNYEIQPIVGYPDRFVIVNKKIETQDDSYSTSIRGSLEQEFPPLGQLLGFWGYSILNDYHDSKAHKEYALALDSLCPFDIAKYILSRDNIKVVKIVGAGQPVLRIDSLDESLFPHQKKYWTNYPDGVDQKWWHVRELLQARKGVVEVLLGQAREVEYHLPVYQMFQFLNINVEMQCFWRMEGYKKPIPRYERVAQRNRNEKTLLSTNPDDWVFLTNRMNNYIQGVSKDNCFSIYEVLQMSSIVSGSSLNEISHPGIPVALLATAGLGFVGEDLREFRGHNPQKIIALHVPEGTSQEFLLVTLEMESRKTREGRVFGFEVDRTGQKTEFRPYQAECNLKVNGISPFNVSDTYEGIDFIGQLQVLDLNR